MNLYAKKLELVQLILNTEKPTILKKVEEILKREKASDWWDDISENERKAVKQGISEADNGDLIQHEQVLNEAREKYKRKS